MAEGGALIFGAGAIAGVGGACATRAAAEGLHSFVCGRTADRLAVLVDHIEASGARASAVTSDCTVAADVARAFDAVERACGAPPRFVVYNAGNMVAGPLLEMEDATFEAAWRVSAFGAFLVGREAARRMVPGGGGTLVFTGATSSLRSRPPFVAFAAAKAAERAVAQGLAREFGPQGLHVAHVVIDGVVDGELIQRGMPELKERLGKEGLLAPDAIADAYWKLHEQPRSAWTFELDLRPYKETF